MQDWDTRIKILKKNIQNAREKFVVPHLNVKEKSIVIPKEMSDNPQPIIDDKNKNYEKNDTLSSLELSNKVGNVVPDISKTEAKVGLTEEITNKIDLTLDKQLKSEISEVLKDDVAEVPETEVEPKDEVAEALESEVEPKDNVAEALESEVEPKDDVAEALESGVKPKDDVAEVLESEVEPKDDVAEVLESEVELKDNFAEALESEVESKDSVSEAIQSEVEINDDVVEAFETEELKIEISTNENIKNVDEEGVKKTELELLEEQDENDLTEDEEDRMYELRRLKAQRSMNKEANEAVEEDLKKADEEIAHLKSLLKPKEKKIPKGFVS